MSLPVIVTPKARQDIVEIADYLAGQNLETAMKFLDHVESSFEQLSRMPELGTLCQVRHAEIADTRVWPVAGFPNHLIFYLPDPERLRILRLMHGAQDWAILFDG